MTDPKPNDLPTGPKERIEQLIELLTRECGELTEPEKKLARAVALGEECGLLQPGDEELTRGSNADAWKDQHKHHRVRASVLQAICVCEDAHPLVDPAGIRLLHAWVAGDLDLTGTRIPFGLSFDRCHFDRPVVAHGASLPRLRFRGCHATGLDLRAIETTYSINLGDGFVCHGSVKLQQARIGANLICKGSCFLNPDGWAIRADGAKINGNAFLRDGFKALGGVRLWGAVIGGALSVRDACFIGRTPPTRTKATRTGHEEEREAINANATQVHGSVYLGPGLRTRGVVALRHSRITGNLDCEDGKFHNPDAHPRALSLDATEASINGSMIIRDASFVGTLDLTRTRIASLNDERDGGDPRRPGKWPHRLILADCRYDAIHPGSLLDARRRLDWLKVHDRTVPAFLNPSLGPPAKSDAGRPLPRGAWPMEGIARWARAMSDRAFGRWPPDPGPYRWLAGVQRRQGHERDADRIMTRLAWRRILPLFNQRLKGDFRDRLVALPYLLASCVYGIIVGHGYARFRPLWWLGGFWLAGGFFFGANEGHRMQPTQGFVLRAWTQAEQAGWTATPLQPQTIETWITRPAQSVRRAGVVYARPSPEEANATEEAPPSDQQLRWIASYPKFSPWVYSLDSFLPLVDFHQEDYWTPESGWWAKDWYLPFHIASGWVIATLFAASFTKLARHD